VKDGDDERVEDLVGRECDEEAAIAQARYAAPAWSQDAPRHGDRARETVRILSRRPQEFPRLRLCLALLVSTSGVLYVL